MPETKPDIWFNDEGVCSACINYDARSRIDWAQRERELKELLEEYRTHDYYDCIVPVSGGKDSTYQVVKMLEYGMTPLAVCAETDDLSDIGARNLENIGNLCDLLRVRVNKKTRAKVSKYGLETVGDISWAEHILIFTIPIRVAINMSIPLIIWGENSQNEYGGPKGTEENKHLNRAWLDEFGGLLGLRLDDIRDSLGLSEKETLYYEYPSDYELEARGIRGIFLGQYLPWDGLQNAVIAKAHGFEWLGYPVETHHKHYENLDNYQTGIHDYFKYLKYGYGRVTDLVCIDIRRGRISREQGVEIVKSLEGKFPTYYLGEYYVKTLEKIGVTDEQFDDICKTYSNPKLFGKDGKPLFDVV